MSMRVRFRIAPVLLTMLAITATTSSLAGADVKFLSPTFNATVLGPSEIRLDIRTTGGVTVERVEILIDDQPFAVLRAEPWVTPWDAGDGSVGHGIHAVVYLSDGTEERAFVRTSRLRIDQVEEVDLVDLYMVVRGPDGRYVDGLDADDFVLLEDGAEQTIKRFSSEPKPLSVSIVLDTSMTMRGKKLESAVDSARMFLKALDSRDEAMVVTFSDRVRVLQELTQDIADLSAAIGTVEAHGGTALYDGVWKAADRLRDRDARRVMILLSDGRDEASNGLEPGSLHTLQEALDHALRCEVMVFAIGYGKDLDRLDFYERHTQADILSMFGDYTGGRVLFPKRTGTLRKAFESVAQDLRHQYGLAYSSTNREFDGGWREITVLPRERDMSVVTRSGYFAAGVEVRSGE